METFVVDRIEELLDSVAKLAVGMRMRYEEKGIGGDVRDDFFDEIRQVDERLLSLSDLLDEFPG